jgi:hypothetical protein
MRPAQPWGDVVRVLNRTGAAKWTTERLRRTVRRLAAEGIVEDSLLDRARPQRRDDRLIRLIARPNRRPARQIQLRRSYLSRFQDHAMCQCAGQESYASIC